MIKKFKLLALWIFNLFQLSKPFFEKLKYVDFVIDNKAIFLISWEIRKAYKIHIPALGFESFKKHASAYIAVPEGIEEVTINISNSWTSQTVVIKLIRSKITDQIDFKIKPYFKEFYNRSVSIPQIKLNKKQVKPTVLNVNIIKLNAPKITNLNYSQN